MDAFKRKLGQLIRDKRKTRGVTQEELAEQVNLTTGMVGQIERGQTLPSVGNLRAIIEYLDLDPRAIFCATPPSDAEYAELCAVIVRMTGDQRRMLLKIAKVIQEKP